MNKEKIYYNLFLDDFRQPSDAFNYTYNPIYNKLEWQVVINYDQFVEKIEYYFDLYGILPSVISFDHDLADVHYNHQTDIPYDDMKEKTGYHCAKWLVDFCMDNNLDLPAEYYAHSMNTVGRRNILGYLDNYKKFYKNLKHGK